MADLTGLRLEYQKGGLLESDVHPNPVVQFQHWLQQALDANLVEPYAMTLATATPDGRPSTRIVLLRGADANGFQFFTNYDSRKGEELAANPRAALLFFWAELERQVRIEGAMEKTTETISDTYFHQRPRASQIAAVASAQSATLPSRQSLEQRYEDLVRLFEGRDVPRPTHWGGYLLHPDRFEFWQGRPSRLHDRLQYRLVNDHWLLERLAP
jgi:pyridoxamine 5'-phosphate oxidase